MILTPLPGFTEPTVSVWVAVTYTAVRVVRPSGVPVTVIGKVPVGVDELAEIVNCVEHVGVQAVVLKEAVAPLGSPEAEKETLWLEPAVRVAVIVVEPAVPCITVIPPELDSV